MWASKFVQKWWSLSHNRLHRAGSCLFSLLHIYTAPHIKIIWQMVVAATLWTIWLAQNDFIFNKVRITEAAVRELIFFRVSKWGSASQVILFTHIPLWRVNPVGAINVHHHQAISNFWKIRFENYHAVCMVDAAWQINSTYISRGGIGSVIKDKAGKVIYCFSGPSKCKTFWKRRLK